MSNCSSTSCLASSPPSAARISTMTRLATPPTLVVGRAEVDLGQRKRGTQRERDGDDERPVRPRDPGEPPDDGQPRARAEGAGNPLGELVPEAAAGACARPVEDRVAAEDAKRAPGGERKQREGPGSRDGP